MFLSDADFELYRDFLGQQCRKHGVAVRAYCLTPNPRFTLSSSWIGLGGERAFPAGCRV
jgi:hypothetical protein